eukprot:3232448-Prorocentrum_lima.AAC.1
MTSSLVGSEMCIRDSSCSAVALAFRNVFRRDAWCRSTMSTCDPTPFSLSWMPRLEKYCLALSVIRPPSWSVSMTLGGPN